MELKAGMIVRNKAGHNIGDFFVLLSVEGTNALISDGKHKKLENPKKKNIKHLQKTNSFIKLDDITNKKIRIALREFNLDKTILESPEGE